MREVLIWVVGSGGLLGSRLGRAFFAEVPMARSWNCVVPYFTWGDTTMLASQLREAVASFAREVRRNSRAWAVIWAAGAGVVGTPEPALAAESRALDLLLGALDLHLGRDESPRGFIFLASSAGGTYGSCTDQPITEASACYPISAYGRYKLCQEALLQAWAYRRPHVSYTIGRISNLYGPGQNLRKPQGLISRISWRLIYRRPIHIYVSLDTIRDYLYVDDCAVQVARCLIAWVRQGDCAEHRSCSMKILASEQPTSVAQIIGAFARIAAKHQPKVISAPTALSTQQPRRLAFRSVVEPNLAGIARTRLEIGISRLHEYMMAEYRQGRLPQPREERS